MSIALAKVCALQKQYGKTQAELETLVEGFCWVLAEHPVGVILEAMREYVKRHSDIPAPADLLNTIDPPPPVLSAAAYTALRKKIEDGYYPGRDERAFLRAFEEQEIAKARA